MARLRELSDSIAAPLTGGAAIAYAATCVLGAGALTRDFRTEHVRWLHHVFFIVTAVATGAAATASVLARPRAFVLLLPAGTALARLTSTRVRPGSRAHARLAFSAALSYAAAVVETVRR
ncbi:hypothetical protein SAMN04489806_0028 [Paramicrobacterium humi]|uniref:DUF423 domain-containing protein n=1 Tax=Paramicrobacterium humi TaxID=640635 RepID=A0A1H4ILW7_9MICO|nr:hypothetical protein [Microbacterium humi]SEB35071.1 hypothetical protein SAMN04489806_0028 [Microbacterium humi]